jgi:hypothetical protein
MVLTMFFTNPESPCQILLPWGFLSQNWIGYSSISDSQYFLFNIKQCSSIYPFFFLSYGLWEVSLLDWYTRNPFSLFCVFSAYAFRFLFKLSKNLAWIEADLSLSKVNFISDLVRMFHRFNTSPMIPCVNSTFEFSWSGERRCSFAPAAAISSSGQGWWHKYHYAINILVQTTSPRSTDASGQVYRSMFLNQLFNR